MIILLLAMLATPVQVHDAKYLECHDGDTCTFDVLQGFGNRKTIDVRFCHVNAPEMKTGIPGLNSKHWLQAQLRMAQVIQLHVPQKNPCSQTNRCEKRSFTRVMAWVMADGRNMTDAIIEASQGVPYTKKKCGGRP